MSLNKSIEEEPTRAEAKPKTAFRGKIKAALLANLSSDSDSDSEPSSGLFKATNTNTISNRNHHQQAHAKKGIYSQVINETKQTIKATHNRLDKIEKQILDHLVEEHEHDKENISVAKIKKKRDAASSSDSESSDSSSDNDTDNDSDSSTRSVSSRSSSSSSSGSKFKHKPTRERSASPPPPPTLAFKKKRKSTTIVDRQLKELDTIKNLQNSSLNTSVNELDNDENDDVFNLFTVRVSTKNGVQKFEINKNDEFLKIYEMLSKSEKTEIENLSLVLNDKKIDYHDTPESINLKAFEIIELNKILGKKVDRIQIIDKSNEDEVYNVPNKLMITFQTSEGRKSRVTFQIHKDEPFANVLKVYCEKKELGDATGWMMEFDGERVDPNENANDLDLDGDEIFDVKKSTKAGASLDAVKSNKNNYEFDDDILVV